MSRDPSDAPGLEWKKRHKDGARIPRWRARKKAVALGYRPSVIQLDIDPNDHAAIAERCRAEWKKMEAWLANERPAPVFDGTLASIIDLYSGDEESPYHDLRYRTQRTYDQQLKVLKTSVGHAGSTDLMARIFGAGIANWGNLNRRDCRRGSGEHMAV